MEKITKAVIACAGFGTRFLPATKAVPKELFPVVDTPVLAFIVNEAKKSGITDVLIVTSKCKEVIKNYFSPNKELDKMLEKTGKSDVMKAINDNGVNVSFVYQTEPKGTADAVACAKEFTKDEPFVLAWGDDLIDASVPVMKQLIDAYDLVKTPIIGVQNIQGDEIVKYGVAKIKRTDGKLSLLEGFVEKPELFELPSRQASLGRYVLTPAIYDAISRISKGKNDEFQITDAINLMCSEGDVYSCEFDGKRYDMGDKVGVIKANVEYALKNEETRASITSYLKELVKTL